MSNIPAYREFVERAYNQGDISAADRITSPTYLEHQYPVPSTRGIEVVRKDVMDTRGALNNLHLTIEDIVEVGDKLWSRIEGTATDPATGKPVKFAVMDICRFENGKMVEHWGIPDRFALLHQIGKI